MFKNTNLTITQPQRKDIKSIVKDGFTYYLFPENKRLYHGTIANTEKDPTVYNKLIKHLVKIENTSDKTSIPERYRKIERNRPLYLSSKDKADLYGCNNDTSFVVNALHHSVYDSKPKLTKPNRRHLIPLYYVKGSHGVTIEFTTTKRLTLFDLGNLKNMKKLVEEIKACSSITPDKKKEYIESLSETCFDATYDDTYDIANIVKCKRTSTEWFDPDLVNILCNLWNNELKLSPIDGWIHFPEELSSHHFEVLLCDPFEVLDFRKIHRVPDTEYKDLPTWDELRATLPKYRKYNSELTLINKIGTVQIDYDKSESVMSEFFDASKS